MKAIDVDLDRRRWLGAASSLALGLPLPGLAAPAGQPAKVPHDPFGGIEPPLPAPVLACRRDDAQTATLPNLLRGQVTAVQLMFTGCSALCPIQGALFAEVRRRLGSSPGRLLSLSIDPLNDDPKALRSWLDRFDAPPSWRAAVPRPDDVGPLLDFLRGRAEGVDSHTGQVFVFDRQARLVWRTPELPPAAHVVGLVEAALRRG